MQSVQLYIQGERVDLFADESVVLTQSIQNVKDISKIFTDFTRTFSVPANAKNNKIFKHYYNATITNTFDARSKVDATIELNHLKFRSGKVKLNGVDLKNNKPNLYRITFFGNTVSLKDTVGEDKLASLSSLSNDNVVYDSATIKTKLQANPASNDVIAPLITHTERLTFDSNLSANETGNLFYGGNNLHGVLWSDLKYALRVDKIVQAITASYPSIAFSTDFFTSTNAPYYNLFMWLHRKKGGVPLDNAQTLVTGYEVVTNDYGGIINPSTIRVTPEIASNVNGFGLFLTTTSSYSYSVSLLRNGVSIFRKADIVGNSDISYEDLNDTLEAGDYTVIIESNENFVLDEVLFLIYHFVSGVQVFTRYAATDVGVNSSIEFLISEQIPNLKIIDFLTGLFRMFNLTAYVDDSTDKIIVKTLDSYYDGGSSYDITNYLDVESSSVNVALPFKEITFEHGDTKTLLAAKHSQIFGKTWGKTEYSNGDNLDGGIYKVKTPFSQMLYERLIDNENGNTTSIQYGYSVDDSENPYIGSPLLFYPIRNSGDSISFKDTATSNTEVTSYNVPSNSVALDSSISSHNINFFQEANEYAVNDPFPNTLFNTYHRDYISDVFDVRNRLTKVSAYLPLKILLNYTLADRLSISGNRYKINSIQTNFKTGKSEIELLNDIFVVPAPAIPPDTTPPTAPVFYPPDTVIGSNQVSFCWGASDDGTGSGVKSYSVYQDGLLIQRVSATPIREWYCVTITGLTSGTSYVFGVSATDFNNNVSATTLLNVTTL